MFYVYHIPKPGAGLEEGYIGVSIDPEERFRAHAKAQSRAGSGIRKYGASFSQVEILGSFESSAKAFDGQLQEGGMTKDRRKNLDGYLDRVLEEHNMSTEKLS